MQDSECNSALVLAGSMLPSLLLEGSDRAREEIDSLIALIKTLRLPFLSERIDQRDKRETESRNQQQRQQRVRRALLSSGVVDGVSIWRARLFSSVSIIQFGGVATAAVSMMSPQGPGCCDFNKKERLANVITSLPYAAIGMHSIQNRRTASGKLWGASMLGVCAASITFHISSGKWRDLGRKLDYWTIALSSGLLTRALYPNLHPSVTAASIALTPFRPFIVSTGNAMAMESKFLQRSFLNPDLRGAQKLHSAACIAGMAVFAVEDASVPHVPLVHATWHCLSALGTAMVNHVLADAEEQFPELTLDALGDRLRLEDKQQQQQSWRRSGEFEMSPLGVQN